MRDVAFILAARVIAGALVTRQRRLLIRSIVVGFGWTIGREIARRIMRGIQ